MGFLTPWFLAGVAAVGLPVYVHLLQQYQQTPIKFSSLMFFERRTQSSVKHRRLKYLLLFALRALFILLLALAGINAAWYQYKYYPHMAEWDTAESVPAGPRIVAVLSLALWIVVIACGRLTAYEL